MVSGNIEVAGLISNYGEFAIIKIRIAYLLPNADIFKGIPVSEPIANKKIAVFRFKHIGKTEYITKIVSGVGRSQNF
jgi:hypothetical protein